MTVMDHAICSDGKRAIVPKSLDHTFGELRTCTDTPQTGLLLDRAAASQQVEIDAVAEEFTLHGLAVEDTIKAHQRPKRERYGDVEFILLRPALRPRRGRGDRRGHCAMSSTTQRGSRNAPRGSGSCSSNSHRERRPGRAATER